MAPVNKQYSYGDFTHQSFVSEPAKDFSNTEIIGSCFYQEAAWDAGGLSPTPPDPRVSIFPAGMTGVVFRRCNLDNVIVPPGNTVITSGAEPCCHRRICVQNDLEDWELDSANKPTEPLAKKLFQELGLSIDPADISKTKLTKSVTDEAQSQLTP